MTSKYAIYVSHLNIQEGERVCLLEGHIGIEVEGAIAVAEELADAARRTAARQNLRLHVLERVHTAAIALQMVPQPVHEFLRGR